MPDPTNQDIHERLKQISVKLSDWIVSKEQEEAGNNE